MFGKKSGSPGKFTISSLIGTGTVIDGDVCFAGGLRIDGTVRGNVRADGDGATVVISEQAVVEGEVKAANVVVNGTITGSVFAHDLELQPKGRILGDVHYSALEMHPGSLLQGYLTPASVEPLALPGLKLASNSV
jgi:cytoskeletal protein CcmA (bactofilin family)